MQIVIPREWRHLFIDQDIISIDDLFQTIEELNDEIDHLQEEYDKYKGYVENNFKELSEEELIGYDRERW